MIRKTLKEVDLSDKNSLTAYIKKHYDILNKIKTKENLWNFIKKAPNEGFYVSDRKMKEVKYKIMGAPNFGKAQFYVYDLYTAGTGNPVIGKTRRNESKIEEQQIRKLIKIIIKEMQILR